MKEKALERMLAIAESYFGTKDDPTQIPITKETFFKLQKLHPKTVIYELEGEDPISWVVTIPTSRELAQKFLSKQMNERELLDLTAQQEEYDAIYLCSAFTVPEQRRKGLAAKLLREAYDAIPHTQDVILFAWPYSDEGKSLIQKLQKMLGKDISFL